MSLENSTKSQEIEEQWISISDMMAGLMVIFLFHRNQLHAFCKGRKRKDRRNRGKIRSSTKRIVPRFGD